jgi:hypothetical protein
MSLEPLADNEWVNDTTTHLAKSGAALRARENDRLSLVGDIMPRSHRGVPVEYDINYETGGNVIRGYKMTDLMTTCLWVAVCMEHQTVQSMISCIEKGPTDEGMEVLERTAAASTDKYLQRKLPNTLLPEKLIVLPGSNLILQRALDLDRMKRLVGEGAYIKPHPITNPLDMFKLKKVYGADKVLQPNQALYPLIRGAEQIWVGQNSEAGIAAIMYGKQYSLIGMKTPKVNSTYTAFYKAFDMAATKLTPKEKMAAIFSHPESGLVSIFHKNTRERLDAFFAQYDKFEHGR